jgi:hypothetical protein
MNADDPKTTAEEAQQRATWAAAYRVDAMRARQAGSYAIAADYDRAAASLEAKP